MNLSRLGFSSWIIIVIVILLLVLVMRLSGQKRDNFVNYPQQINPMAEPKANPEADTANNNYASILLFLKNNPDKSGIFIKDIRQKFFTDSCAIKDNIDFPNIAQMPFGMPFS